MKILNRIFAFVFVSFCGFYSCCLAGNPFVNPFLLYDSKKDYYIGTEPSKAKVVIVEYGSFTCVHCKDFYLDTIPYLKSKYINKGLPVSVIHRVFVGDSYSLIATVLLKCKKHTPSQYSKIVAGLYATQSDWVGNPSFVHALTQLFLQYGYTKSEIDVCLANGALRTSILQERVDAIQMGKLEATPMVAVNGVVLSTPTRSLLDEAIQSALAK